jgi:hypothetical protein
MNMSLVLMRLGKLFAAAGIAFGLFGATAVRALDRAHVGRAEVSLVEPPGGAFVGEMILVKFQAAIHGLSALDDLHQPDLTDLDWRQLGRDRTFETEYEGFTVRGYERIIAVYPQRSGRITIDPFVYHLTMIDSDNSRVEVDISSAPVSFGVRPMPALAQGTSWLPAKSVTITDSWDKRPDRLALGETARRTVTIEAEGIGAEQLPPPPKMRAHGVISFAGPVERTTRLMPQGPIARGVYRWDIRPVSRNAAILPAFPIRWFDTVDRQSREVLIPEKRVSVALANGAVETDGAEQAGPAAPLWQLAAAGFGGLLWGAAALYVLTTHRDRSRERARLKSLLAPLRMAARADDAPVFRLALVQLGRSEPRAAHAFLRSPEISSMLAALDAYLFGPLARPQPALGPLYKLIAVELRRYASEPTDAADALAPLDGAIDDAEGRPRTRIDSFLGISRVRRIAS